MTAESTGYEILDQYRNITSKLKKRFLRKPNETEASESFVSLAQQCESQDIPQYAALSWIAAARCEGTLGNSISETSYLLKAARQFLDAESADLNIDCTSIATENLQAGLACFSHASSRFGEDNTTISLSLDLEIVDFLKRINRLEFLKIYLINAINLSKNKPDGHLYCLTLLQRHFICIADYVAALNTCQEVRKILENSPKNGYKCEIFLECEINSVFLLLILKPSPQNIQAEFAKILEKYTWGDQNDAVLSACKMSEKLFLLMQSLVIICQSIDTSSLQHIEAEFWSYLNTEQKDLLRRLIKMYYP